MSTTPVDTSTSLAGGPFAVRFQRLKAELHLKLIEMLDPTQLQRLSPDRLKRELRTLAKRLIANSTELLSDVDRERLLQELLAEALGLGPLEPLLHDPTISDILVNGPNTVYVERNGRLELTPVVFAGDEHLRQLIQRIVSQVGRRTDESSPMVDARLPDGSRVHAILPPLSLDGPALSIRRFGVRLTTEDLLALGTLPVELLTLFQAAVEARVSVLISGGTGSGKTTFLNVLSHYIPEEERLITIEDAAELKLQQKHVIRLETRPASIDGQGQVTTRDLVRNSLRMRPDRIIVGECRGAEALDMLQAMNTGHEGSLTTVHANDAFDALARLEMMVLMNNMDLPISVLRQYISSGIPLIIQLTRLKGGPRKVTRVLELAGFGPDGYVVNEIFGFRQTGVTDGVATGEFYATGYVPRFLSRIRAGGIDIGDDLFAARVLEVSADPFSDASSAVEVNLGATPADSGLHGRPLDSAYDVNLPLDSNYDVDLETQAEYDEAAYDEDEVAYEADPQLEAFDEVAEDGVYEDLPEDEADGTPDEDDRR